MCFDVNNLRTKTLVVELLNTLLHISWTVVCTDFIQEHDALELTQLALSREARLQPQAARAAQLY
jgi:hypothetical protein